MHIKKGIKSQIKPFLTHYRASKICFKILFGLFTVLGYTYVTRKEELFNILIIETLIQKPTGSITLSPNRFSSRF